MDSQVNGINGLHHLTAIASDAQKNVDFYVGVLGLRMVKQTINYDDPGTYHLYYGDTAGSPGTILTFFPWPGAVRGTKGTGETKATALLVPHDSLPKWETYLREKGVAIGDKTTRFNQTFLPFEDPDGMLLELTEGDASDASETNGAGETAIIRMAGVSLRLKETIATEKLLTETLGFVPAGTDGDTTRFVSGSAFVDLVRVPNSPPSKLGAGSVHHVAWRVATDEDEIAVQEKLQMRRVGVSPVTDRQYFHSIYFKEPGGVLFEVATDPPGFTADETLENLGTRLRLPSWLESKRAELEAHLGTLVVPARGGA